MDPTAKKTKPPKPKTVDEINCPKCKTRLKVTTYQQRTDSPKKPEYRTWTEVELTTPPLPGFSESANRDREPDVEEISAEDEAAADG